MASKQIPSMVGQYRDGRFRRRVRTMSTGSTARYDVSQVDSGSILVFGVVSTASVGLPRISSKWLGLEYTIYFSTADAEGDYTIQCLADSSAVIHLALTSGGVGTASTITPLTTDSPHAIRVTAISSIVWLGEPLMMSGTTAKTFGSWTTA